MNTPLPARARASVPLGLLALLSVSSLAAQTPAAPPTDQKKDGPAALEAFEVTGSRVKRLDYETPSPVITYSAATIEDKGYANLGEFMQSLPFNNSAPANSEFTTGELRHGRRDDKSPRPRLQPRAHANQRPPRHPLRAHQQRQRHAADRLQLQQHPVSRRSIGWNILKDGASAIYGSDAITGVFNMILKKNYERLLDRRHASPTPSKHDSLRNRRVEHLSLASPRTVGKSPFAASTLHGPEMPVSSRTTASRRPWTTATLAARRASTRTARSTTRPTCNLNGRAGRGLRPRDRRRASTSCRARMAWPIGQPKAQPVPSTSARCSHSRRFTNDNRQDFRRNVTHAFPVERERPAAYASINAAVQPAVGHGLRSTCSYSRSPHATMRMQPYELHELGSPASRYPATNPYNPHGPVVHPIPRTSAVFTVSLSRPLSRPKREVASIDVLVSLAGLRGTALFRIWNWEDGGQLRRQNGTTRGSPTSLARRRPAGRAQWHDARDRVESSSAPPTIPDILTDKIVRAHPLDNKPRRRHQQPELRRVRQRERSTSCRCEGGRRAGHRGRLRVSARRHAERQSRAPSPFIGFTASDAVLRRTRDIHSGLRRAVGPGAEVARFPIRRASRALQRLSATPPSRRPPPS